jgi:DNA topoisomerase-2
MNSLAWQVVTCLLLFQTLFDEAKKKKAASAAEAALAATADIVGGSGDCSPHPKAKGAKRLSVERIYQKKTQLEHILLRPDTYIGSIEAVTQVNNQL